MVVVILMNYGNTIWKGYCLSICEEQQIYIRNLKG